MAVQLAVSSRNAAADAIEADIGTSPILEIRTGAPPASAAAADTGTVLASLALPSDWLAAAANGAKALSGVWQDISADAAGDAGHFRIKTSGGACKMQGTVSMPTGDGDMKLDNTNIAAGQQVTVTSFTLSIGGA